MKDIILRELKKEEDNEHTDIWHEKIQRHKESGTLL